MRKPPEYRCCWTTATSNAYVSSLLVLLRCNAGSG
jgi:hypothetical protein